MKATGKPSEKDFVDAVRAFDPWAWIHRYTDASLLYGLNKRLVITPDAPADYQIVSHGVAQLCEVKSTKKATSFAFGKIRTGQMAAARMITKAGGSYNFYINRTDDNNKPTKDWFRVPASVVDATPKRSLTWGELEAFRWRFL